MRCDGITDSSGFQCPRCGQIHLVAHDQHEVTVQDLRMTGRSVYLHFRKGRVMCCRGQPELEYLAWVEKNSYQTVRLKHAIYEECKHSSVSAVAERQHLSWATVKGIDKEMIKLRLAGRDRLALAADRYRRDRNGEAAQVPHRSDRPG